MCPVEKVAACEISFIPIRSSSYITDVERVLDRIRASGLEYSVGALSTVIRGEGRRIFRLVEEIYHEMDGICGFRLDVNISNICGCEVR